MKDLGKYFDFNATSPLSSTARDAWLRAADSFWHNPSGLYREAAAANFRLEDMREALADRLGCGSEPDRVVFTSGATESNNAVAHYLSGLSKGGIIGVSAIEHPAVTESVGRFFPEDQRLEIPVDAGTGQVDPGQISLEKMDFLSVMAANNETGTLQDWRKIAACCRENGVLFHCDAAQWVGKMPASDIAQHCDFVTGSGHKFGGPKGVGFLILPGGERAADFHSQIGGPQESGHRAGTEDLAGISAMIAALEEKPDDLLEEIALRQIAGRDAFEARLLALSGFEIIGQSSSRLWNTSLFVLPHTKNLKWLTRLSQRGFAVSTGSACSAGKGNPSRVMEAMGLDFDEMGRVIRVSGGWETTGGNWAKLADAIEAVGNELQGS